MPPTFPSHQGLVVPLWRRFPDHFNVLALYVGAATPDVVDASLAPLKGSLGQWYGHTLLGSFVLCIPYGLALTGLLLVLGGKLATTSWGRWVGNGIVSSYTFPSGCSRARRWRLLVWSVWIGALTHDLVDFITHKKMIFFYPWYVNRDFFPEWWTREWFTIWLPGYREPYSAGWHLVSWVAFGILGILLFLWSIGLLPTRPRDMQSTRR